MMFEINDISIRGEHVLDWDFALARTILRDRTEFMIENTS
jgi:hypothetical protein